MKTKAELEAEVNDLKVRVAELEGQVSAYQYALTQVNRPEPAPMPYYPSTTWTWPDTTFPNVVPTPYAPGIATYNIDVTN